MKELLAQLATGQPLSEQQAHLAFDRIMSGEADPIQTAAMLSLIQLRGPAVEEIVGAAQVMRERVCPVEVPEGLTVIDTCGMGGTGSIFFNISTTAALVAAAVARPHGVTVAKHGNRAITSRSGSAQVLESLGVKLQVAPTTITRCLDEAGIGFCFAPSHHKAMKHAMPIRQSLGFRTIFNLLGPLTNPAGARRQLIGVPSRELTQTIAEVLCRLDAEHAIIVHSESPDANGLGELTTFGPNHICELRHGTLKTHQLDPESLGLPFAVPGSLTVDGPDQSAALVRQVLEGRHGPARDIVALNAAAALLVAGVAKNYQDGLDQACQAIDNKTAARALDRLISLTQADPS